MPLRLLLDGQPVPPDQHSPLDRADLTRRRRDSSGQAAVSLAADISFYGPAYDRIKAELIDAPDARHRCLPVEIEDDCCAIVLFRGRLCANALDWCADDCSLTATLTAHDPDSQALDCLRRTPIADDRNGFRSRVHPFVRHCIELRPALLQDLVLIFALLLNLAATIFLPLVLLLEAIVTVLQALVAAVNSLCGNCLQNFNQTISVSILDEYNQFVDRLNDLVIGCGRGHISPYVRDYLDNVCAACGLTASPNTPFHDPTSPYYDTVYFHAPAHKGHHDYLDAQGNPLSTTVGTYWRLNGPHLSGIELLDQLATVFNARWWVEGGVLHFEAPANPPPVVLDWASLPADRQIELCYRWQAEAPPAWARFAYALDAADWVGNEARDRWNAWVDYTQPWGPPTLQGERTVHFPFGTARFRDDGLERDVLLDYRSVPFIGPRIRSDYDELLLLPLGLAFQPKLLLHNAATGFDQARIRWHALPNGRAYSADYWLQPDRPDGLYARFWQSADPRLSTERGLEFRLSFVPTCSELAALGPDSGVQLPVGLGRIEQVIYGPGRLTLVGRV